MSSNLPDKPYKCSHNPLQEGLVAGYAESTLHCFHFRGSILESKNVIFIFGGIFAISCGLRTNGLLWAPIFVYVLVVAIYNKRAVQAVNVVVGGCLIGSTILGLQYYACIQ
jgi:hypothetical protein